MNQTLLFLQDKFNAFEQISLFVNPNFRFIAFGLLHFDIHKHLRITNCLFEYEIIKN